MKDMPEIKFPPEAKERAIDLAAYDIMKQLCIEGKITDNELQYISKKYKISVEKL